MRFIHTSDLHIGKIVNGFSMLEEQKQALDQIAALAVAKQVSAVFLCGDLYDRPVPPAAAVTVLDQFLTRLVDAGIIVLSIAGNHDCGERIGFGSKILDGRGLYMEGLLSDPVRFVDIADDAGVVRVHLVPYEKPAEVRALYGGTARDYEESMEEIVRHVSYLEPGRNIVLTHQFVINAGQIPQVSDSESRVTVGGADQVEAANFEHFDYVALGHIHGPQQIGERPVYYSGSPVKYSFSEVLHQKTVILGDMKSDGSVTVEKLPLTPIHDMRKIRGKLADLIRPEVVEAGDSEDYILAVLTNEEELIDPIGTLRSVYPNVMQLQWERKLQQAGEEGSFIADIREKPPLRLFQDFFLQVMEKELGEAQEAVVVTAIETAKEELR